MIIFGQRKYYKHDSSYRYDICEECGQANHLHSYSVRNFFHVYWAPLIPLGKKRIIDQCPSCDEGREMSFKKWTKAQEQELPPLIDQARNGTLEEGNIKRLLSLITLAGTKQQFLSVAAPLIKRFPNRAAILANLGRTFQRFGMNKEAKDLINRSLAIEDRDALRTYQKSLSLLGNPGNPPAEPNKVLQMLPMFIAPAAILFLLFSVFYSGADDEQVFLVNGLTQDYQVYVNGDLLTLPAESDTLIEVNDIVKIEPRNVSPSVIKPFSIDINKAIIKQQGGKRIHVVNPDCMAVLLKEELEYIDFDASDQEPYSDYGYLAGECYYQFEDIYYPFEAMPDTIDLPVGKDRVIRKHIEQVMGVNPVSVLNLLLNLEKEETALAYAKRGFELDPEHEAFINILGAFEHPDSLLTFLNPWIESRPLLINVHRNYQGLIESIYPEQDLVVQYQSLLDAGPDNNDMKYLLGRVTPDSDIAMKLYKEAAYSANPSAFAFYAIAYDHITKSQHEEALVNFRKAISIDSTRHAFRSMEEDMLLATGRYDELIERRIEEVGIMGLDLELSSSLLLLYGLNGDKELAASLIEENFDAPEEFEDIELRENIIYVFSQYAAGSRDLSEFIRLNKLGSSRNLYQAAIAEGDPLNALMHFDESNPETLQAHLLLYSMASYQGNTNLAKEELSKVLEFLDDASMLEVKKWFEDETTMPKIHEAYKEVFNEASLFFTALGFRHPAQRRELFAAARKANYNPSFPGLVLSQILE